MHRNLEMMKLFACAHLILRQFKNKCGGRAEILFMKIKIF